MVDTMLDLLEICQQKELYCIHNNVDDLFESALNSKLLFINSQHLDKEKQEMSLVNAITPDLSTEEPEDSLIMGNEELSNIPKKESDKFIKSSVEDLIPIPIESEDTSGKKSVTFSNPLFDSNDDFTSSDDESLSDKDVPKDNFKICLNPLFEFDDEYISSDVNPLFDEVLEDIECKDSYDSNLDESTFLVTPLSDSNEDECFTPSDDVELLLHHDPSTPTISNEWKKILYDDPIDDLIFDPRGDIDEIGAFLDTDIPMKIKDDFYDSEGDVLYFESLLSDDTTPSPPPKVFLDRDPRSLRDINDLKIMVTVLDPEIHGTIFSPTYVSLPFEDRHYLTFTYVIRIFLPYFTYLVKSSLHLSSESEDIIFDPGISVFSLKPMAYEFPTEVCSSTCFIPNITIQKQALHGWQPMLILSSSILILNKCDVRRLASSFIVFCVLWFYVQDFPDCEDSRAGGFVHRPLDLQSFTCLYIGF
ncbi:hypothetical protein Tco_0945490 [Tanacetum coccineum]